MTLPVDPISFIDGPGHTASGEQVNDRFDPLYAWAAAVADANGLIDTLAPGVVTSANLVSGLQPLTTFKALSIATEQVHTSGTAYGTLPTPDTIADVVVPANGLLLVGYRALAKESVGSAGRAAIFLGGNQLQVGYADSGTDLDQQAKFATGAAANVYEQLVTCPVGLAGTSSNTAHSASAGTGRALGGIVSPGGSDVFQMVVGTTPLSFASDGENFLTGGFCVIEDVPASTLNVSIQFKATSGTVTAKNRKLWVGVLAPQ